MLQEEGHRFMGAAFEVFNHLGYGMAEEIPFQSKRELAVYSKDRLLGARYRPDLTVYDSIVVELKAISELVSDHEAQLFNSMRVARRQVGYLLNFGKKGGLQWKRFILSDLHSPTEIEKTGDEH